MPTASEHLDSFYFIFYGIGITAISLFGIIVNLLSIIVFSRTGMRCSNSTILLALSVWDVALLVSYLFSYGLPAIYGDYSDISSRFQSNFSPYIYLYGTRTLRKAGHTGSVYSTLLVTFERYLVVCHPILSRKYCTRGKAITASVVIGIFAIVFNIPRWFDMRINEIPDNNSTDETTTYEYLNSLQDDVLYMKWYRGWLRAIVMYITPFVVLPVLNYCIHKEVVQTNKTRQTMTWFQQTEVSLNKTLMSIVTMFLISNMPYAFFTLGRICGLVEIPPELEIFAHLLVAINSSLNFIIYCAMGTKFRSELVRLYYSLYKHPKYKHYQIGRFTVLTQDSCQTTICSGV